MSKAAQAFRTISEVAEELDIPKHVLRFWELKFPQIKPMKRGGGRRYYRPEDVDLLRGIRHLLHAEGYTIKGVQKILREQGVDTVKTLVADGPVRGAKSAEAKGGRAKKPDKRASAELARQKLAAKAISGRGGEAGPVDAPPSLKKVIDGAIAELRACRSLLEGAGRASTAVKKKATATRSTRRARAASN